MKLPRADNQNSHHQNGELVSGSGTFCFEGNVITREEIARMRSREHFIF